MLRNSISLTADALDCYIQHCMTSCFHHLIVCSFAITSAASADIIILNCTSSGPVTVTAAARTAAQTLTCPQFNPSQGTLNNYSIAVVNGPTAIGLPFSGSFTLQNTGSSPVNFPYSSGNVGINAGTVATLTIDHFPGQSAVSFSGPGQVLAAPISIAPGASAQFSVARFIPPFAAAFNSTSSIGSYIGIGSFQVPVSFGSTTNGPSAMIAPNLVVTDWSMVLDAAGIQMIYAYTPASATPEPSTLSLALGGIGLFCAARRLKAQPPTD